MKVFGLMASAVMWVMVASPAFAQSSPPPYVAVTGSAEVQAAPDKATLSVAADVKTKSVAEGEAQVQRQVKALLAQLSKLKIADDKINSAQISIRPEMRWDEKTRRSEPDGYRVRRDIRIEIDDLQLLGPVLKAATDAGITEVSPPQLGLKDLGAVDRKALALAATDARLQAQALADALGLRLGEVLSVEASGDTRYPPPVQPMMRMVAAEAADSNAAQGILTGELTVTQRATIRFRLNNP